MEAVREIGRRARSSGEAAIGEILNSGTNAAQAFVTEKLAKMVETVNSSEKGSGRRERLEGVDESKVLTFINDKRRITGVAPLLLAVFLFVVLPIGLVFIPVLVLCAGLVSAFLGYVWPSHVDVPEGYVPVVCNKGDPDRVAPVKTGRNWVFDYMKFIPYLVAAKQDQVVRIRVANFTRDFASVTMNMVIVFRITDPAKFAVETSPAVVMGLMQGYARYTALRMITSIDDSRVKFTGLDNLENVAAELNRHMGKYGITVTKVTVPEAENGILEDLEGIRIVVNEAAALRNAKEMRLEAGVKAVETEMRKDRKNALSLAQGLRNAGIEFQSAVSVAVNATRQKLVIGAQRTITERFSELMGAVAELTAKITTAKALEAALPGLEADIELRMAEIKRRVAVRMLPREVTVLGVDGIGTGVGMGVGRDFFLNLNRGAAPNGQMKGNGAAHAE